MIDLDELAATEVERHRARRPPLSTVAARSARRRRARRAATVGAVLGLGLPVAGAAALLVGDSGVRQDIVAAEVTTTVGATSRVPEPIRAVPPVVSVAAGSWLDELLPDLAAQFPTITEVELRAALDRNLIESDYHPGGTVGWEGLLSSGIHEVDETTTAAELLQAMSDRFADDADNLGYRTEETPLDLTPYELIIVASIVEAEARTEEDRPRIARVIYNRIEAGLALGIDAICLYGSGDRETELTAELLGDYGAFFDLGYDCRTGLGLPPTPIATPGRASLAAAIDPTPKPLDEDGSAIEWLFYVPLDREGNHFFTDDFEEFTEQKARAVEDGLLS